MDSAKIRSEIDLLIKDTTTYDKDNLPNQLLKDLAKWHWGSYGWVSPASLMFTVAWRKYYYPAVDCCKIWAADENNKPIPGGYSIRTEDESISILRCIAGVVRQVLVILPDMPLYGFYAVLGMRAKLSGGTIRTNSGVTLVFPVAVPVCGGIFQDLVFRANHTVIEFIIDILPPLVAALHRLRALVSCRENSAVIKHLLANMGRLISGIRYNHFCFGKCFRYLVVYLIKSYAVMDIPGSDHRFQHKTVFVTGSMGFVSELTLVAALYE